MVKRRSARYRNETALDLNWTNLSAIPSALLPVSGSTTGFSGWHPTPVEPHGRYERFSWFGRGGSSVPTTHLVISVLDMAVFCQYPSTSFQPLRPCYFSHICAFFRALGFSFPSPVWAQEKHIWFLAHASNRVFVCVLDSCLDDFRASQMYFYVTTKGICRKMT